MLDAKNRIRTQSAVDQENAAIAEMFECEEYRLIMLAQIRDRIIDFYKLIENPAIEPESEMFMKMNIVDLINVLRLAQLKLTEVFLGMEEE